MPLIPARFRRPDPETVKREALRKDVAAVVKVVQSMGAPKNATASMPGSQFQGGWNNLGNASMAMLQRVTENLSRQHSVPVAEIEEQLIEQGLTWGPPFPPGRPLDPFFGFRRQPRTWDYTVGENVQLTPRWQRVSFETLKAIYEAYDVAQICVRHLINDVRSLDYDWVPLPGERDDVSKDIDQASAFFEYPDKAQPFRNWLAEYLQDVLRYDAGTLYVNRTNVGDPYALEVVTGASIIPLIDFYGRVAADRDPQSVPQEGIWPGGQTPGFLQIIEGMPWNWLTVDDIIYQAWNPLPESQYGQAPLESILLTANTDIRFQQHFLEYFTAGTLPAGFMEAPQDLSDPASVKELQDTWDALMAGDQEMLRRIRFVPFGSKFTPVKNSDFDEAFPLYLMRRVAAAYGITPANLGFTETVNRATSDTQVDIQWRVGTLPLVRHVEDVINLFVRQHLKLRCRIQFDKGQEVEDRLMTMQAHQGYVDMGAISVDEVRAELGKPIDRSRPIPRMINNARLGPIPLIAIESVSGKIDEETYAPDRSQQLIPNPYIGTPGTLPPNGSPEQKAAAASAAQMQRDLLQASTGQGPTPEMAAQIAAATPPPPGSTGPDGTQAKPGQTPPAEGSGSRPEPAQAAQTAAKKSAQTAMDKIFAQADGGYGDMWVNDSAKKVVISFGDWQAELGQAADKLAVKQFPGYSIDADTEQGDPANRRVYDPKTKDIVTQHERGWRQLYASGKRVGALTKEYMPQFDDERVSFTAPNGETIVGYVQMVGENGDIAVADEQGGESMYLIPYQNLEPVDGPYVEVSPNVFEAAKKQRAAWLAKFATAYTSGSGIQGSGLASGSGTPDDEDDETSELYGYNEEWKAAKSSDALLELRRWREQARNSLRAGQPFRQFHTTAIPETVQGYIRGRLEKAETRQEVNAIFADVVAGRPFGAGRTGRAPGSGRLASKASAGTVSTGSGMVSLDIAPGTLPTLDDGVRDQHITIVFIGKGVSDDLFDQVCERARLVAASMGPPSGTIGGLGQFPPSESSGWMIPVFAIPDVPAAEILHAHFEDFNASEHTDYHPHVTLGYFEDGEQLPDPVPETLVSFSHLSVHRGDDVRRFPFKSASKAVGEKADEDDFAGVVAGGVIVQAEDTGRVLMIQRLPDKHDDYAAYARWEWPGGCLDVDDAGVWDGALREWEEETGSALNEDAQHVGSFLSEDGVYQAYVVRVPSEDSLEFDPQPEEVADIGWWDPADLDDGRVRDKVSENLGPLQRFLLGNVAKYSDDEPRDDHGRFAGGGSASAPSDRVRQAQSDYTKGWNYSGRPSANLEHLDRQRASTATYHGYADRAAGREKWQDEDGNRRPYAPVQKYSDDEPRDDHGQWTSGGSGGHYGGSGREWPRSAVETARAARNTGGPQAKPWQAPPVPAGKEAEAAAGGMTAIGITNTKLGDAVEHAVINSGMGFTEAHPGIRQGPFDVLHGKDAYEIKAVTTDSTEFKAKPSAQAMEDKRAFAKEFGLTPHIMIVVYNKDTESVEMYAKEGVGAYRLSGPEHGWSYLGSAHLGKDTLGLAKALFKASAAADVHRHTDAIVAHYQPLIAQAFEEIFPQDALRAAIEAAKAAGPVEKYSPDQPRDEQGRFGSGGGGSSDKTAALIAGERVTASPKEAVEIARGLASHGAPVDLTNMHVTGHEQLFDKPGSNIPRAGMPRIPSSSDDMQKFAAQLNQSGVKAVIQQVSPLDLRATQSEINGVKAAQMLDQFASMKPATLIVDKDGNLLDGHHRWAAASLYALSGHADYKVDVLRCDAGIGDLMTAAHGYDSAQGISGRAFGEGS